MYYENNGVTGFSKKYNVQILFDCSKAKLRWKDLETEKPRVPNGVTYVEKQEARLQIEFEHGSSNKPLFDIKNFIEIDSEECPIWKWEVSAVSEEINAKVIKSSIDDQQFRLS